MPESSHVQPEAFFLPGGPVGALLLHGYTGSPPEMRLIGDYLNARGVTVLAPLLPGHGTTPQDLATRSMEEWVRAAEVGLGMLQSHCQAVFVAGLSMGSLLTLYLAGHHPELPGAIAYSPAVIAGGWTIYLSPLLRYFIKLRPKSGKSDLDDPQALDRLWSYPYDVPAAGYQVLRLQLQVRRLLPKLSVPLLIVYSPADHTIAPTSGRYTYERAGSPDKQLLVLERSGHCITVDSEWEQVAERTYKFIVDHTPENLHDSVATFPKAQKVT